MLTLALALALTQMPQHRLFLQPNLQGGSYAMLEVAPPSGAGMTGVCAGTNPTGATGQAITVTRATSATCTRGADGTRTTGIANGDLATVASGIVRQELHVDGITGLRVELAATNVLLRYTDYANAAWADVGTPTLTGSQTDPFGTTGAVTFDDNDAVAFEGRSQAVTVSAGAAYTMHCYAKAGTLDQATLSLDGTTQSITGLSATTWSIVTVTDASTSGVSVSAQVLVGDAAGDTGTVIFGGCQVESASIRTSIMPTTGTTATRNADLVQLAFPVASSATVSMAASFVGTTPASGSAAAVLEFNGLPSLLNESAGLWRWFSGAVTQSVAITSAASGVRTYGYHDGSTRGMQWGPNVGGPTADVNAANKVAATFYIGGSAGARPNGIISRICADTSPSRCR